MKFATKAIHAGQSPEPRTGAVNVPIYMTSTYSQTVGEEGYEYSRTQNPTREALEENVAALEGADHGLAFASGMGAIATIMTLLQSGDHVVVEEDVYGGTHRLFKRVMENYGLRFDFTDFANMAAVEAALGENTRMLWAETPTNPLLKILDLRALGALGKEKGVMTVVDNTFATPYLQRPLEAGIDVVVHSTTKYLGGHSDIIGGVVVTSREDVHERLRFSQNAVGVVPSPFDCFLALRGIRTLPLRMEAHCRNALEVALFLTEAKQVSAVRYPGLEEHPQHSLAKAQMRAYGGVVTFELGDAEEARAFMESLKLVIVGESLGGVESLIEHPASMTHESIPKEEREARGISGGLIRLSVGCEALEDLREDLQHGLAAI